MAKTGFRRNSLRYQVNEKFFDLWTPQMAYILGFTYADGNIHKASLAWDIQTRDKELLKKFRRAMNATYPIANRSNSVRLRINNQNLVEGAITRGLLPKKNMRNETPKIPQPLLRHFIRGYLDGDGWVVYRKNRRAVETGFVSGNKEFLSLLEKIINKSFLVSGKIRMRKKITSKGIDSKTYHLEYSCSNAMHIIDNLYGNLDKDDIYLERKYKKYLEAKQFYSSLWKRMKSKQFIEREYKLSIKEILLTLHTKGSLNGVQIAKRLGTSKSSVYRWMTEI